MELRYVKESKSKKVQEKTGFVRSIIIIGIPAMVIMELLLAYFVSLDKQFINP